MQISKSAYRIPRISGGGLNKRWVNKNDIGMIKFEHISL